MNKKDHVKLDLLLLGYTIPEVHGLIDKMEALNRYNRSHRRLYHNWDFIRMIKSNYGSKSFNVAFLHLLVDLNIIGEKKELERLIK